MRTNVDTESAEGLCCLFVVQSSSDSRTVACCRSDWWAQATGQLWPSSSTAAVSLEPADRPIRRCVGGGGDEEDGAMQERTSSYYYLSSLP